MKKPARKTKARKTRRANPPGRVLIGDQVDAIYYRKGQRHDCNRACKEADHRFVHKFNRKFPLYGLPNGKLEI